MKVDLEDVSLEVDLHSSAESSPFFLISHPHPVYGGTMRNKVVDFIYRRCVEKKYSVLRYNMRGVENSTGAFDQGVGEEKDLYELIEWLLHEKKTNLTRLIMVGYSFGSWITANIVAKLQVRTILIAPPLSSYSFPRLFYPKSKLVVTPSHDEFALESEIQAFVDSMSTPKAHVTVSHSDHYFIGTTHALVRSIFQTTDGWFAQP